MENAFESFCFQCEQTAHAGCTGMAGTCGKTRAVTLLQDELTGALIGLARAVGDSQPDDEEIDIMLNGLFSTVTNVSFDDESTRALIGKAHALQEARGENAGELDCDLGELWGADEDTRSLKSLVLFGLRGMAAYAYHARTLGHAHADVDGFFFTGLRALADDDASIDALIDLAMQAGAHNLACMEQLDRANVEAFGTPAPATVAQTVEPGPFIIVTGHDLRDLHSLLEQAEDAGVNVYTHGEMLPAHAYPELRRFTRLKGNFGTAWQNQQKEFADVPAPILFTTNCLMPPRESYHDRVFTSGVVQFPGAPHIGAQRDFSAIIAKAKELGGYEQTHTTPGANGGTQTVTGFGHDTMLGVADKVIDAVRSGALKRIFLVGGCDGARAGRSYYTDFVKATPADTAVLTLGCGKFRFNDLDLGQIGDLPRLMDMGQCNDAFGAVVVAIELAKAFGCGVNDLPLTLVLSWYEQKAVCILLTLLHLGIKGIYLGPTLPAFLSPSVVAYLVEHFDIHPTTTPETDLKAILG